MTLHKDRNSSWRARRSRAARPLMRANRQHATQRFDASTRGFYIRRGLVQTRLELELFCRSTETNGLWLSCIPHDTLCRRQEHRQGGFIEALKAGNVRKADPQGRESDVSALRQGDDDEVLGLRRRSQRVIIESNNRFFFPRPLGLLKNSLQRRKYERRPGRRDGGLSRSASVRACGVCVAFCLQTFSKQSLFLCFCEDIDASFLHSGAGEKGGGSGSPVLLLCASGDPEGGRGPKLSVQRRREAWREVLGLKLRPSKLRGPALRCSPSCVLLLSLGEA